MAQNLNNRPRHYRVKERNPEGKHKLADLLTISEAAALWRKHPNTIKYHCEIGNFAARQSGSIWLISKDSIVSYYGHSPLIRKSR